MVFFSLESAQFEIRLLWNVNHFLQVFRSLLHAKILPNIASTSVLCDVVFISQNEVAMVCLWLGSNFNRKEEPLRERMEILPYNCQRQRLLLISVCNTCIANTWFALFHHFTQFVGSFWQQWSVLRKYEDASNFAYAEYHCMVTFWWAASLSHSASDHFLFRYMTLNWSTNNETVFLVVSAAKRWQQWKPANLRVKMQVNRTKSSVRSGASRRMSLWTLVIVRCITTGKTVLVPVFVCLLVE